MQNEAVSVLGDTDAEMSACVSMFVYFFFSDTLPDNYAVDAL